MLTIWILEYPENQGQRVRTNRSTKRILLCLKRQSNDTRSDCSSARSAWESLGAITGSGRGDLLKETILYGDHDIWSLKNANKLLQICKNEDDVVL